MLYITYLLLFLPQTVRVVIWRHSSIEFYVHDLHLLVYTFFCVFLCWFLILVIFILFPYRGTTFRTYLKGLDILLWPWLEPTDFWIVDTETCVIGCVEEWDSWDRSVLAEWEKVRGWLFGLVCDKGLVEFVIWIIMVVEGLLIHWLGWEEGSGVKSVTKNEFKW